MILILLRPPLAHSQNICVIRRAMTLPNVLNRANLGPPPRSLSICPPPAQQFILSHKSLAPLRSAALLRALTLPHVTAVSSHLRSAPLFPVECCFLSQICAGEIPQFFLPKARYSPRLKRAEFTACRAILHHTFHLLLYQQALFPRAEAVRCATLPHQLRLALVPLVAPISLWG